MKDSRSRTANVGLINALTVLSLCSTLANAQPQSVVLAGTIRDFTSSHPDFGLTTGVGGPVCGLVDFTGTFGRPSFVGAGSELTQHALDGASLEIAPHLYAAGPEDTAIFMLEGGMDVVRKAVVDLYDPDAGVYDASTAIPMPVLDEIPPLEPLIAPTMSVVKVNAMKFGNAGTDGTSTLTGEHWCDTFWVGNAHTLTISGDVVIRVDKSFAIRNISTVVMEPGSSLTIWAGGTIDIDNNSTLGMNATDHSQLTINNFGTEPVTLNNSAEVMGTINSPEAPVECANSSEFYGGIVASSLEMDNTSGVHIAGSFVFTDECFNAGDTQEAAGLASGGQVNSAASFNQWFNDVPGVNLADQYQMVMTKAGQNYEFSVSNWDPINAELYGNEGADANRGFTMDLQGLFMNDNCSDLFIEIESEMDVWLFIDDTLAIDLGGTTGSARQRIELDRLGLGSQQWHRVRLYIAQRLNGPQGFTMTTSLPLTPPREVTIRNSNLYD